MQFFSQHGQDRYLYETAFRDRRNGVYVDIGAYDGETLSNTVFFERHLGWTGLCVEPLPNAFAKLKATRTATCLNVCIGDYDGEGEFLDVDMNNYGKMYSGLIENYDKRHVDIIRSYALGGQKLKVPVRRLAPLLDALGLTHIDYMTIDTEGSELKILLDIDLRDYAVEYVSVENNYQDQAIVNRLHDLGYERIHVFAGFDELYRRRA